MDLLDDRVAAVGLVGCDCVEEVGVGGGEEGVEPPGVEQGVLAGGLVLLGVEVRDPADYEPVGHLLGLLLRSERGERHFGDLGTGDPLLRLFIEDEIGVLDRGPGVVGNRGDRSLDGPVHPHRHRHRGTALEGGVDRGAAVER
jgi:hypothetical protein